MPPYILKPNPSDEYYFAEGCFILELSNSSLDPELSIARARVLPAVTTRLHQLCNTIERYVILEGSGRVKVGDLPETFVTAGDVVLIPPQVPQQITNTGTQDLVFLAICTPRFQIGCYQDLEN